MTVRKERDRVAVDDRDVVRDRRDAVVDDRDVVRDRRDVDDDRVVVRDRRDVVDDPVVVRDHRDAVAEEGEVVTRRADGYSLARGWMRVFNMMVGFILLLIETALAFRLAFKLAGANAGNGFVTFIYDVSNPFISPFKGIVNHSTSGKAVFEPETVIAMAVWAVVAILLVVLVNIVTSAPAPSKREAVSRERYTHVDRQS